jgi:hypothetical protein
MSGLAEATIRAIAYCPGRMLLTSEELRWTSLLVRITEFAVSMDAVETSLESVGERATSLEQQYMRRLERRSLHLRVSSAGRRSR